MNKRTRNWILIVVATAIILAVGYFNRHGEEAGTPAGDAGTSQGTN